MYLQKPYLPVVVSPIDAAFPTNADHLMLAYEDIPDTFKKTSNPYVQLVNTWFFSGLKVNPFTNPYAGIDRVTAQRHLKCIMGSWEPSHEHKEAAVAFLISKWFVVKEIEEKINAARQKA